MEQEASSGLKIQGSSSGFMVWDLGYAVFKQAYGFRGGVMGHAPLCEYCVSGT
jgi:hypothetical protein